MAATGFQAYELGVTVKWEPGVIRSMDPDLALAEALDLAVRLIDEEAEDGDDVRLAELVLALNRWMASGGFMPSAWERQRV